MPLFELFRNYLNALIGRNQEFEKLLAAKDITAVKEKMTSRVNDVIDALKEYTTTEHKITKRPDKMITDKKGNFLRYEPIGTSNRFSKRFITAGDKPPKSNVRKKHVPFADIAEVLHLERSK